MARTHTYSKKEEIANAITHGFGALLSIAALVLLVVFSSLHGGALQIVSFTIYGITMLVLYVFSTLTHSFPEGKVKDVMEFFDHSSIYLFIAGTYTPLLLNVIRGTLGWSLFTVVWAVAVGGVVFKAFFTKQFLFTSTLIYILMGWIIVFAWHSLIVHLPSGGVDLLVAGGVCYTLGTVFYVWRSFPYHHAVWHLFVLGGTVLHFFAVLLYMLH